MKTLSTLSTATLRPGWLQLPHQALTLLSVLNDTGYVCDRQVFDCAPQLHSFSSNVEGMGCLCSSPKVHCRSFRLLHVDAQVACVAQANKFFHFYPVHGLEVSQSGVVDSRCCISHIPVLPASILMWIHGDVLRVLDEEQDQPFQALYDNWGALRSFGVGL